MPSIDESGLAERACQLRTSKRVVEHQLPLARLEANRNLLTPLDLLAHHRSFLTLVSAAAEGRRLHAAVRLRHQRRGGSEHSPLHEGRYVRGTIREPDSRGLGVWY